MSSGNSIELRDAIARELYDVALEIGGVPAWGDLPECNREVIRARADRILALPEIAEALAARESLQDVLDNYPFRSE